MYKLGHLNPICLGEGYMTKHTHERKLNYYMKISLYIDPGQPKEKGSSELITKSVTVKRKPMDCSKV